MNTKKLRQKILDLAIHGKLVAQNPNDEPASELLKRINPKAEIISNSEQYENLPFDIPKNWCWTTLGKIGKWQSGSTPSRLNKDYYNGNIPWLKTGDLNDGYITHIPEYITEKALNETSVKLNPAGSVLIAMYGATIGKIGILTFPATTNQACCACEVFNVVEKEFLFFFLLSHREEFIKMGGGGAQPNISKEKIINTFIPLPPLAEQKRIVEAIDKWFALIDSIENNKADLETTIKQTKSKILDLAIHGKLVAQNPNDEPASELLKRIRTEKEQLIKEGKIKKTKTTDNSHYENVPFEIPNSWEWTTLEEICFFDSGYAFSSDDYRTEGIPLIRISNIKENQISIENCVYIQGEYEEKFQINNGDLLIAMSGATTGKMGIYRSNKIAYLNQRVGNIKVIDPNVLCFEYRNLFLQSKTEELLKLAYGGAQPNISGTMILGLQAPLPPLAEQKRIVEAIDKAFKYLDAIAESL